MEAEIAKLLAAQATLEEEKTKALSEGGAAKKEAERLEQERIALESEKGFLLKQVEKLKNDLDLTESQRRSRKSP